MAALLTSEHPVDHASAWSPTHPAPSSHPRTITSISTSTHVRDICDPANGFAPFCPDMTTPPHVDKPYYVDWNGDEFLLPVEMLTDAEVPWVPSDAMVYGKMGNQAEQEEIQGDLGDILHRLGSPDSSGKLPPYTQIVSR